MMQGGRFAIGGVHDAWCQHLMLAMTIQIVDAWLTKILRPHQQEALPFLWMALHHDAGRQDLHLVPSKGEAWPQSSGSF